MRLQANFCAFSILSTIWPALLAGASLIDTNSTATNATSDANASNTYDYIIVGSGPGGGPLAARLAEAGFSVLLLEAGEDHGTDDVIEIPLFQGSASEFGPITWQFFVDHYANQTMAMQDPKFTWKQPDGTFFVGPNPPAGSEPLGIYYPRASTLGGCAEHNALIALYPAESDWDNIAHITGDESWAASNMRQFWEKLENNQYLTPGTPAAAGHGFAGFLDTTLSDLSLVVEDKNWLGLVKGAATAMGVKFVDSAITTAKAVASLMITDANNDSPTRDTTTGLYQMPLWVTKSTRARSSQRNLLLSTASNSKLKLKIQMSTLVSNVIFDHSSKTPRAVGVQYLTGSHLYRAAPGSATATPTGSGSAFARREVILSGGTFNSPQLLKLSGIGPKDELNALNIPVVLDAPGVGTNMQDRYEVSVIGSLAVPSNFSIYENCTFLQTPDPCLEQWQTHGTSHGIYGTNAAVLGAFVSSSISTGNQTDFFVGGVPANFHGYFPGYSNASDRHTWSNVILKAHSHNNAGTVKLASTDPRDMPKVLFNSFEVGGDLDLQAVFEAVQLARKNFQDSTTPDGKFVETLPGPEVKSESEVKNWIKTNAWGHHASCSVPIGAADDPNAVLDSKFRVKGVNGLRVVDASVFPKIPGFYIVGAIFTISEKAAAVIIEDAHN